MKLIKIAFFSPHVTLRKNKTSCSENVSRTYLNILSSCSLEVASESCSFPQLSLGVCILCAYLTGPSSF